MKVAIDRIERSMMLKKGSDSESFKHLGWVSKRNIYSLVRYSAMDLLLADISMLNA